MEDIHSEVIARLAKEAKRAQKEDLDLAEAMQRLVSNRDFILYQVKVLGKRIDSFGQQLLEPSGSMDGMVKSEFLKGALFAFCLARDIPSVIVSAVEAPPASEDGDEDAS